MIGQEPLIAKSNVQPKGALNGSSLAPSPPAIETGWLHAYYIFDIAETIDLSKLSNNEGFCYEKAPLELRSLSSPGYIQYASPPVMTYLPEAILEGRSVHVRVKLFDYGTVSIRLSFACSGAWVEFAELSRTLRHSPNLEKYATNVLKHLTEHIAPALNKEHVPLVEDYFIAGVESFESPISSATLLSQYRGAIAGLILGETKALTHMESEEAMRQSFSYFENDLAVMQWDAAFVYDTKESAETVESIIEFANTQLVELRTYDAWLDAELDEIYKWDLARTRPHWLLGRRAAESQVDRLRSLLVDIRELSDRASNSLKIIGDAYYARLYRAVALRLGLIDWQQQIESKLASVAEIYRFATDRAQHSRSEFLEVIIIVLILLELILGIVK